MARTEPLVIAIDGPAASGKGTLARRLAQAFDLPHLDTGLTYRAVAAALLGEGKAFDDEEVAVAVASQLDLSNLDKARLSAHAIGEAASKVAVMPKLRAKLVERQKEFARQGAVMDGRDIGTVVCPNATVKLFITASASARAKRRYEEAKSKGEDVSQQEILDDIQARDERDQNRANSPLKMAEDAHLIDTTKLDIEAAFTKARSLVLSKM